jgi:hypothetical protein
MNFRELDSFKLSDAVNLHSELNPALFDGEHMLPEVRQALLAIAKDFVEFLGIGSLDIKDIRLSGSNAAYSYTPHSDVDLHILVDFKKLDCDEVYAELFNAKKLLYNDKHNIKVHGYDVELYVQDANESVKSLGEYSILNNRWIRFPSKRHANLDQSATRQKFVKLVQIAELALQSRSVEKIDAVLAKMKKYRQAGLDKHGEFSPENLAYKALRSQGVLDRVFDYRDQLHSQDMSLDETEIMEASGYIPSEREKNDPRFKTALTIDVHPNSIKRGAKAMGLGNISRAGIPQQANPSGKFKK